MKQSRNQSVENYFSRFQFPGGIRLYPLDHLAQLTPLRAVNTIRGGSVSKGKLDGVMYESQAERREISRVMKILQPVTVKTQVVAIQTPQGKMYYPDVIAQLSDGTVIILEIKHILDMLWDDVLTKYQSLLTYCKDRGYGAAMMDGKWRDFTFLEQGGTIHFIEVVQWFESCIQMKGEFTMKDLRAKFPQPKYWPTLVSYCLLNGYRTHYSFRDARWAVKVQSKL